MKGEESSKRPDSSIAYLDAFADMLTAERAASRHTISAYMRDVSQAGAFFARRGLKMREVQAGDVTRYLQSLKELAPRSRARKRSALSQYFRFLVSEGACKTDPMLNQESVKLPQHLPSVLSVEEMRRLIDSADSKKADGMRMRALLELAYGSGLRVSELTSLPLVAYNPKRRVLLVRGKGGKERLVPLSAPALLALQDYIMVRGQFITSKNLAKKQGTEAKKKEATSPFLFPSRGKEGHLTRIRFYQMLKDVAVKAGIPPKKIHPHALRHAFATHILAGGADLRSLQQMLGHADIATTQIYTHLAQSHLQRTVNEHHPLAKKGLGRRV